MYSYTGNRNFQQGGIAAFLVVALLLAGVVGGGLMLVKWRTDQASIARTASTSDTPGEQNGQSGDETPEIVSEEADTSQEESQEATPEQQSTGQPAPREQESPTQEPSAPTPSTQQPSASQQDETQTLATGGPTATTSDGDDTTQRIVATGPGDGLMAMFVFGIVAVFAVRYAQSERKLIP